MPFPDRLSSRAANSVAQHSHSCMATDDRAWYFIRHCPEIKLWSRGKSAGVDYPRDCRVSNDRSKSSGSYESTRLNSAASASTSERSARSSIRRLDCSRESPNAVFGLTARIVDDRVLYVKNRNLDSTTHDAAPTTTSFSRAANVT